MFYKVTKEFLVEFKGGSEGVGRLEVSTCFKKKYFSDEQINYQLVFEKFEEIIKYFGYYIPLNFNIAFNLELQAVGLNFFDLKLTDYNIMKSEVLKTNILPDKEEAGYIDSDLDINCEVVNQEGNYNTKLFSKWHDSIVLRVAKNYKNNNITHLEYHFQSRVELFNEYPYGNIHTEFYLPTELVYHNRKVLRMKIEGLIEQGFEISGESPFLYDNDLEKYGLSTIGVQDPSRYHG